MKERDFPPCWGGEDTEIVSWRCARLQDRETRWDFGLVMGGRVSERISRPEEEPNPTYFALQSKAKKLWGSVFK